MGSSITLPVDSRPPPLQQPVTHPSMSVPQPGPPHQPAAPVPASTPSPGPLRRTATTGSVQSLASSNSQRTSLLGSLAPSTPLTPVTMTEASPQMSTVSAAMGSTGANSKTCASCKQVIPHNVSIFSCLVCSTAEVTADFCVWCFTTGAAVQSHPHDSSFYGTDSDLRIHGPTGNIPPHIWTVRKNASGRLWYSHIQTGFKTHLQPMTAFNGDNGTDSGLPSGWQEMKTPDGKLYYSHAATGATSWTKPANSLPSGWRIVRTPDNVPYYVHDGFHISTWDRPGELPKQRLARSQTVPMTTMANGLGKKPKPGITAADVKTAASVANNVAKLSAASDLSASGILTASVAAARLTGLGMKIAGQKMGRMGKGTGKRLSTLSTATNLLSTAARLTGDDDGGDFEGGGDVEEIEQEGAEELEQGSAEAGSGEQIQDGPPEPYVSEPLPAQGVYGAQSAMGEQPYFYPQPAALSPGPMPADAFMMPPQAMGYPEQPMAYYGITPAEVYPVPPQQEVLLPQQEPIGATQQPGAFLGQASYAYPQFSETLCVPQQEALSPPQEQVPGPQAGQVGAPAAQPPINNLVPPQTPVIVTNINVTVEDNDVNILSAINTTTQAVQLTQPDQVQIIDDQSKQNDRLLQLI